MNFLTEYLVAEENNEQQAKRSKLVAGNWKMHLTSEDAKKLVKECIRKVRADPNVEIVFCPPYPFLYLTHHLIKDTLMKLGAQDVFWKEQGAFTGKVSPKMLLDSGVEYCIVGHSETRGRFGKLDITEAMVEYFAETNSTVNLKIKALFDHLIHPILCVGETHSERVEGLTEKIIEIQMIEALKGIELSLLNQLVIAYEPVWAIGTGDVCGSEEAEKICKFIRNILAEKYAPDIAGNVRILYGGSLKSENAAEIFRQPNIDGGLIGRASLEIDEFCGIIEHANKEKK